jgi:hypothetical protein
MKLEEILGRNAVGGSEVQAWRKEITLKPAIFSEAVFLRSSRRRCKAFVFRVVHAIHSPRKIKTHQSRTRNVT